MRAQPVTSMSACRARVPILCQPFHSTSEADLVLLIMVMGSLTLKRALSGSVEWLKTITDRFKRPRAPGALQALRW